MAIDWWARATSVISVLFFVTAANAAKLDPDDLDFVIDIDNVLVYPEGRELTPEIQEILVRMGVLVTANKKYYRVAHGAGEFLQSLSHIHGSRISFYSAHGRTGRSAEILGQIRLPNGKTAWEIAHNILFYPSVVELEFLDETRHSDYRSPWDIFNFVDGAPRQKKDLTRVTWRPNLGRMVLVDDAVANAMPGQEKNLLWSKPTNGPIELTRVRGLIDRVLDRARRKEIDPAEALFGLQWTHDSRKSANTLVYDDENARDRVLERGLKKLRKENPHFNLDAAYMKVFTTNQLADAEEAEWRWNHRADPLAIEARQRQKEEREMRLAKSNPAQECWQRIKAAGRTLIFGFSAEKPR